MVHPCGKQTEAWLQEAMAGGDVEGSVPEDWGEKQGMMLLMREGGMGKVSAGSGSVRGREERRFGWTGRGVSGCLSVRVVG